MARTVGIGKQDFEKIVKNNYFYVDKTYFIKEWWENGDDVTLITRPRRFGKTLAMSMMEKFFSIKYADRGDLFRCLSIWGDEKYRELQGTYPVISLSFASVKEPSYQMAKERIYLLLIGLYDENIFLLDSGILTEQEQIYFRSVSADMPEVVATMAIHKMSLFLSRYYGRKVIILLDEYDTPMQEAYAESPPHICSTEWVNGYWDDLVSFTRSLFNAAFKTNPYMERAIMTGITRVSRESVFSDLNNLEVVTTTSKKYADCFGFTEQEVFTALEEYGLSDNQQGIKEWYDGFTFGNLTDIYNPWSIINYLDKQDFKAYWANTSSNSLVSRMLREGSRGLKMDFEGLISGGVLKAVIDEQIVFSQLDTRESAVWSLLLASGYLKVKQYSINDVTGNEEYELTLTNREVSIMFVNMIGDWFAGYSEDYHDFIRALLIDDMDAMNLYMNKVTLSTFSFFDTGTQPGKQSEPERFYHGFVLGMMVELMDRYNITSNRESGFGRYDMILEPKNKNLHAIIMEFKVYNPKKEKTLNDTVQAALKQIEEKQYDTVLKSKGIPEERIRRLGFAFKGKQVLIGS